MLLGTAALEERPHAVRHVCMTKRSHWRPDTELPLCCSSAPACLLRTAGHWLLMAIPLSNSFSQAWQRGKNGTHRQWATTCVGRGVCVLLTLG